MIVVAAVFGITALGIALGSIARLAFIVGHKPSDPEPSA